MEKTIKRKMNVINERLSNMVDNYVKSVLNVDTATPSGLNDNFIVNEGFTRTIEELKEFSKTKTELDDLLD